MDQERRRKDDDGIDGSDDDADNDECEPLARRLLTIFPLEKDGI